MSPVEVFVTEIEMESSDSCHFQELSKGYTVASELQKSTDHQY